jgi:copper chaperone CopZ
MAVRRVKGVHGVEGDAKGKILTILFDPEIASVKIIKEAMAGIGYDAEEL